ncbi:hypothetical protein [Oligoflexus tunisiensis]|uniref:hypothetical protein n=1 Tax=Oligoflexus tunisiensis TaxID=708132 RepID=UPI00114CFD78|nr:hypothetical protein [Oligoflexus tunisiensis]
MVLVILTLLSILMGSCGAGSTSSDSRTTDPSSLSPYEDTDPEEDPEDTSTFDPAEAGSLIIDQIATGEVSGADLPTVTYDIVKDVSSFVADPTQNNAGTLQISLPGLRLASSDEYLISSSYGGSVRLKGEDISASRLKGTLEPSAFMGRQGFPALDEGLLAFDLATTETSIDGTVSLQQGKIGDISELGLEAVYKLYKENSLWRGKMSGKMSRGKNWTSFEYDYDTPILTSLEAVPLDGSGNPTSGPLVDGGTVRVKLSVNSNAPVNWLNITWDSPTTNLSGGGSGITYQTLGQCSTTAFAQSSSTFCEHSRGFWTLWQDYVITAYQPSGVYTFQFSVKNAALLTSRTLKATVEAQNANSSAAKPVVEQVTMDAPSSLGNGLGGTVKLDILVSSTIPVNWLNLSLEGPTSNVFGGGSGTTFQECSSFTSGKPAICGSFGSGYWYKSYEYAASQYVENGTYQFNAISVASEANVTSDNYGSIPSFTVAGNTVPTTPVIDSGNVYTVANYGDDPLTLGALVTGTCLEAGSQPDPLIVALVLEVSNSNVPVNWLNRSFEGPTENLEGGGSGPSDVVDLGSGSYRVIQYHSVASPSFAPKGLYYYQNLTVVNEGNATSASFGGTSLGFQLKTSCP